jgi:23S rRNA (cytidine1920-2'-O)/16S rRNA (cytidine1409-2'-O)-methyltransferase
MTQPKHDRLDQILLARGLFSSRSRARDAIERGTVRINGEVITKPGQQVFPGVEITVDDPARDYVSRAALKLASGLDHFRLDPEGRTCLDIGISTGGFAEILLQRGAAHVIGIDVGHGQLHARLKAEPRLTSFEGLNARDLDRSHLGGRKVDAIVSDVSFISLKLALPPALGLAEPGSFALLLVKPQFEAGREAIGKNGLLKDPGLGPKIAEDLSAWLDQQPGWKSVGTMASPLTGGDGNREYLLAGWKEQ